MIVGILTDGDGELIVLPAILRKSSSTNVCLRALKTGLQFNTKPDNISTSARKGMLQLRQLGAEAVIVVLDRETSDQCSGALATGIRAQLVASYGQMFRRIDVVLKDRMLENWLIADVAAIEAQPARFDLSTAARNAALRGHADSLDALGELKRAAIKVEYSKTVDAQRIAQKAQPLRIAAGSRSFRRLLRVFGDPAYAGQSQAAVTPDRFGR